MKQLLNTKAIYRRKLKHLQNAALVSGLSLELLKNYDQVISDGRKEFRLKSKAWAIIKAASGIALVFVLTAFLDGVFSSRCLLNSNYLVWEATRPLAECSYCENVTRPVILWNITPHNFKKYAYSSQPIIIKNAISHWKASKEFSYNMFKRLYEQTEGSYESLDEGCQFLNFKTDLFTLKEVFSMTKARANNEPGEEPWYVGWGNCHPDILAKVRNYYSIPDFLPIDAEYPATENIFFGYEIGAVMHLDYIPRLMWQGQVKGNKTWSLAPVPECEQVCQKLNFYVEPGDIVLLDTRIWYHATSIPKGQFSLTVQSEYG